MAVNLLLKDFDNRVCERMNHLSEMMDNHISKNVVEMCVAGMFVQVETINLDFPNETMLKQGWTFDDGLYEKLLIRYFDKTQRNLTRWVK